MEKKYYILKLDSYEGEGSSLSVDAVPFYDRLTLSF